MEVRARFEDVKYEDGTNNASDQNCNRGRDNRRRGRGITSSTTTDDLNHDTDNTDSTTPAAIPMGLLGCWSANACCWLLVFLLCWELFRFLVERLGRTRLVKYCKS